MRAEEIKGLMEAYSHVYETPEVLSEELNEAFRDKVQARKDEVAKPQTPAEIAAAKERGSKTAAAYQAKSDSYKPPGILGGAKGLLNWLPKGQGRMDSELGKSEKPAPKTEPKPKPESKTEPKPKPESKTEPKPGSVNPPTSSRVLSKLNGVEGTGVGKDFVAKKWSDTEKSRYSSASAAAKPAAPAKPAPGTKAAGPESIKPKTANPLLKDNSISDMIKASQMRQKGVDVTSDNIASVRQSVQQANKPEVLNKQAPAGSALRAQQDRLAAEKAAQSAAKPAPTPVAKPAPTPAAKPAPTPAAKPAPKPPAGGFSTKEGDGKQRKPEDVLWHTDIFDLVKGHLLDEGYAETEENAIVMMANMSEEWRETIIMELTGGKGHPGYKAGSKDHGDLEDHPAAGKKGGVLSPRYGHHLGDMDDEDEDEDDLESTVKQQSRDSRERTRKPLRDKVKAARKKMSKEEVEYVEEDSRRMSNKQKTASVRQNIKAFGSNFTPPNNYDPDANRGQGEVLTRKQIEKKRRKELRKEENENGGLDIRHISALNRRMERIYEAQRARENPEDHDKEEKRKYEPVRGERTPMPPRGDKRREEFEKWYAKQMGR